MAFRPTAGQQAIHGFSTHWRYLGVNCMSVMEAEIMRRLIAVAAAAALITAAWGAARAADGIKDYSGPLTTQALYQMCSQDNPVTRDKCYMYIEGLTYGLNIQKSMQEKRMPVCLPALNPEAARVRILRFIDETTREKPENNKDGGDWMAFMGLAAGNICKK